MEKIILQKFIAQSGYCSRRNAEELIRGKKVKVNDKIAELGMKVDEDDDVRINGKKVSLIKDKIYIKLNKPVGYTCTTRSFKDEKNVFDLVDTEKLIIAGRLDKDSHGLVILTNDGDWVQKITHPKFEHEKKYIAKTRCALPMQTTEIIQHFKSGINIGEGDGIVKVKKIKALGENKFGIILTEGKKRQIRRMFDAVNYEVYDLERTAIGDIELGDLKEGQWEYFKLKN